MIVEELEPTAGADGDQYRGSPRQFGPWQQSWEGRKKPKEAGIEPKYHIKGQLRLKKRIQGLGLGLASLELDQFQLVPRLMKSGSPLRPESR
jgi:hypothetical protein